MAFRKRREALRSILTGSSCIRPGSVYDAISIRIAEDLGFELGMFGGSVASLAVLGDPDITLITLTELAEQMRRMSRAASLAGAGRCRPWLWQCAQCPPHGAGAGGRGRRRPHHRGHAAAAGLWRSRAATDFARGGRRQDEGGAGRPQRSVAGHHGPHRRGRRSSGLDDAIARAKAYEATGVDALFFTGIKTRGGARGHRGRDQAADRARRRARGTDRPGLSRQPAGADRVAGPRAVRRGDAGGLRDAEGAARGHAAEGSEGPGVIRSDRPRHARGRREGAQRANFSGSRNR